MTAARGLFLIVTLGVITMVGAVLANWIPRPATLRTRWVLAALAGVVLVSALLGLVAEGRQQALNRRPLADWVSDVNDRCAAHRQRTDAAVERDHAARSQPERLSALQDLEAAHSDLYKEVSGLELPSDPDDRDRADKWLDVYGVRLDRLTAFVEQLRDLLEKPGMEDATSLDRTAQSYVEATTTAGRVNGTLGISCP
ncbi:hypothetical protein E1211_01410 [Micromonospora sp. 15K316]|uniref:hypothetical protein n=1 Tax=Micromonospora sp. 15K316 TaxID=2530376 RepID=UPI0010527C9C|nr:hypothetical protein [Micromonospora sp. 15K316]TDC40435.1 hypothetical protein E1211_01410 [Micromonospora sp. 15K316]